MLKLYSQSTVVLLSILLTSLLAFSQVTSRVAGVVQDPSGASIPSAKVTLTNEATNISNSTNSTSSGSYLFDGIQPGKYTLSVEKDGFRKFTTTGNVLTVGLPLAINASMQIGSIEQTVEVQEGAEAVQTQTSGNIGSLVDQITVTTLPIVGTRGRSPLDLLELQPGIVDSGGLNQTGPNVAGGGVSVNGSRDRAWNYTLDGIDINETSAGGSNFSPLRTNPDSISEFRVLTSNFTSEYGRNSGAEVIMATRSGTNQFHGTGFFFYQTPGLLANDPGNKASVPPLPRPQFVQKIPGFSFGGPVFKNKTFFFVNMQWLRTLQTALVTSNVYTAPARQGLFRYVTNCGSSCRNNPSGVPGASVDSSGNVLPGIQVGSYNIAANDPRGAGLDPSIQKILGMTPLPNNYAVGDGLNLAGFTSLAHQIEKQMDLTVRIDHTFNQNNTIFGRWAGGHQNTIGDNGNGGLAPFPNSPNVVDTFRQPRNLALGWRTLLSPVWTNEMVVGMNRFIFNFANPDPHFASNPPFIFNDSITTPLQNYVGNKRALTTFQLADNMSYLKGSHVLKWGINFRYQRHIDDRGSIGNFDAAPAVLFDTSTNSVDPAAFKLPTTGINNTYDTPILQDSINNLLGRVGEIDQGLVALNNQQYAPPGSKYLFDFRMPEYDFYFQDSWKILPNLVIDAGVRWELKLPPNDTKNKILRPNQPFGFGAAPSNTIAWAPGQLYHPSYRDFGPSIGIAWDPTHQGKTSIRANYRLAYDNINTFSLSSGIFQGLPGATLQQSNFDFGSNGGRVADGIPTVTAPPGVTPLSFRQPVPFSRSSITTIDPHWQPPQVHEWSFGVQQEIMRNTVLEMDYIGHHAVHLYGGYDANQAQIRSNGFLQAFNIVAGGGDSPLINQLLANDSRAIAAGETGSQYLRDPNGAYFSDFSLGSVAKVAQSIGQHTEGGVPLPQLAGFSPFFFFPYPQFSGGFNVLDSHDRSSYHALQTSLRRSFSGGLTFQASYSWSKSLDTRSFDPTFTLVARNSSTFGASSTPFDNGNRRLNYAPSDFDRTHVFQSNWVYQLPFGEGKRFGHNWNGFLDRAFGGWELAGVFIRESGRPTTVFSPAYTLSSVVRTPADCTGCTANLFQVTRDSSGNPTYITPESLAKFTTPAPGAFSNVGRNYFRLGGSKAFNLSIGKVTKITERQRLETRLEIQNVTNSVFYDQPASARYDQSSFGLLNPSVIESFGLALQSNPRSMQLAAKYTF